MYINFKIKWIFKLKNQAWSQKYKIYLKIKRNLIKYKFKCN